MKDNSTDFKKSSYSIKLFKDIQIGDYIIKQTIGEGAFSKVKLAIHKASNSIVAIKIIDKSKMTHDDEVRIKREIQILTTLNHQNVIIVNEIFENSSCYYIVMEYCPEGELFNYIIHKNHLSEEEASLIFYQIMNGLEYIHNKGISHRDLKPENILLLSNRMIKIIDFGLSNYLSKNKLLKTPCGSPCYAAPEMIKNKHYDGKAVDIWSAGIILFAMICGYLPFENKDNQKLFSIILNNKPHFPKNISANAKDIINKMISKDSSKRITMEEIKFHPFYLQGKNIYNLKFCSTYDDLYKIKNLTGSSAAFSTDRNSNLLRVSEYNDDTFKINDIVGENEDNKEIQWNNDELIYEKEKKPTYEERVSPISKIVIFSAENTVINIDKLNRNEEAKIIKVNKCFIKNKKNNGYNVPPIILPNSHHIPCNFGLTTYNMFKNKIGMQRRLNSNDRKPKIANILNTSEISNLGEKSNSKNTSFRMTFYNSINGQQCNKSIELDEYFINKKTRNKKNSTPVKEGNVTLYSESNKNNKKKRINQSIEQDSIIEKFYKKFNLKVNYPSMEKKEISNKKERISRLEVMKPKIEEQARIAGVKKKNMYSKVKAKVNTNLDKIVRPTRFNNSLIVQRDKKKKGSVSKFSKTLISMKEKLCSYRAPNLVNFGSIVANQTRLNSQSKQRNKVQKIK